MRDVTVGEVAEAVVAADFFYEEGKNGAFTPVLRDGRRAERDQPEEQVRSAAARVRRVAISNVRVQTASSTASSPTTCSKVRDLVLTT
jgi:hypothetical protein